MKNWKFLKQPEFIITTLIAILLSFIGGANYDLTVGDPQGSIVTQG